MARRSWGVAALVVACSAAGLSCPTLSVAPWPQVRTAVASGRAWTMPEPAPLASDVPENIASLQEPPEPAVPEDKDTEPDLEHKEAVRDVPMLGATVQETWVFSKPSWKARKLGYLRAGALVERSEKPAGRAGCDKGWYKILPRGFVCVGNQATIEPSHAVLEAGARRPDRANGLPYDYGMSKFPPPPLYLRLPSEQEQREVEPDLDKHLKASRKPAEGIELGPIPGALLYGGPAPSIRGPKHSREALYASRPVARSGFALLQSFDWTDRPFGLTTDMNVIPIDRTRVIKASSFQGVALEQGLPAAFVRSRGARKYRIDPLTRARTDAGPVAFREGFALTGQQVRIGGELHLEARDGTWIREKDNVVIIPQMKTSPGWATGGRKWVDISILRQALVAYEGTRPVYVTLVSTGVDGLGDPEKTHSTVQGVFQVHTKHVAATMDGDDVGDEFDLRDVPFVQYFSQGYAMHGAYWHDDFGNPRSHGCVNLAPKDASWLFAWTDPQVPEHWHAYLQPHGGTIVYTHP